MSQSRAAVAQLPPSLQRLIVHGSPEEVFREGEKYFEAVVLGMLSNSRTAAARSLASSFQLQRRPAGLCVHVFYTGRRAGDRSCTFRTSSCSTS